MIAYTHIQIEREKAMDRERHKQRKNKHVSFEKLISLENKSKKKE